MGKASSVESSEVQASSRAADNILSASIITGRTLAGPSGANRVELRDACQFKRDHVSEMSVLIWQNPTCRRPSRYNIARVGTGT